MILISNTTYTFPPILRPWKLGGLVFMDAVRIPFAVNVVMTSPYSLVSLEEFLPL